MKPLKRNDLRRGGTLPVVIVHPHAILVFPIAVLEFGSRRRRTFIFASATDYARTVLLLRIAHPYEPEDDLELRPPIFTYLDHDNREADPSNNIEE